MANELRFLKGTSQAFTSLTSKSEDNFYVTTGDNLEDYCLYLGDKLLAKCGSEQSAKDYADKLKTQLDSLITELSGKTESEITRSTKKDAETDALITKNKVSSSDKTITLKESKEGTDAKVNIDGVTLIQDKGTIKINNDVLSVYNGKESIKVLNGENNNKIISLNINSGDKTLTQSDGGLLTNIKMKWDSVKGLELLGKGDTQISQVPASQFLIDGLLEDVVLNSEEPENPKLVFTFKTEKDGKKTIEIPLSEFIDVYLESDGISISGQNISIKLDETADEQYLAVTTNGLKTSGIKKAIDDSRTIVSASSNSHISIKTVTSDTFNNYVLSTTDVASEIELSTHTSSNDIHILPSERTKWDKNISDLTKEISDREQAVSLEETTRKTNDDKIIQSVGLNTDGTYISQTGNYINNLTKITEETKALDTNLKLVSDSLVSEKTAREGLKGSGNINVYKNDDTTVQTIRLEWGTF